MDSDIINEYEKYPALADTIKIKDITSNKQNQTILQQLKDNNEAFSELSIGSYGNEDNLYFSPQSSEELAWLGYFIGRNTNVWELYITSTPPPSCDGGIEIFRKGLSENTSIFKMVILDGNYSGGKVFQLLNPFMESSSELTDFEVEDGAFGVLGGRQLSLALGGCNKALNHFRMTGVRIHHEQLINIITALSMHPQLQQLETAWMEIGLDECTALATLLRNTTTQLKKLDVRGNDLSDEEVELLVSALDNHKMLRELDLGYNEQFTLKGWKAVASLLERPNSNLQQLDIYHSRVGDKEALIFANVLANDSTVEALDLTDNIMTPEGWSPFSKLLCDTSSVNNTYMSNHTLRDMSISQVLDHDGIPGHIQHLLNMNRKHIDMLNNTNKGKVAMDKIVYAHSHLDMEPFFEWELKVLPLMIEWFTKAAACIGSLEVISFRSKKVGKMHLSAVYDFIREFPMLYVEPMTRKEIAECTALEEELLQRDQRGSDQQVKLEEIRCCKARSMRRLGMK